MICQCKQCGKKFNLTEGEIEFYKSKGLSLPKRCKECRKINNNKNNSVIGKKASDNTSVEKNRLNTGLTENKKQNFRQSNKSVIYVPPASSGKRNFKTFIALICLVPLIIIAVFAGKYFKNTDNERNEDVTFNQLVTAGQTQEIELTESEPETKEITEILTDYTQSAATAYETYYYTQPVYTQAYAYRFRNNKLLTSHYEKHGIEMGFSSKEAYEAAASAVITNPNALSKPESDDNDGDTVYFIKSTGEIVFLSSDGYIRSYFTATEKYYNKQ